MYKRQLLQLAERPTASFDYIRWMGPDRRLTTFGATQRDMSAVLDEWLPALRLIAARTGTAVGYCNNHFAGHAPATLRTLQASLGQRVVMPSELGPQGTLFG